MVLLLFEIKSVRKFSREHTRRAMGNQTKLSHPRHAKDAEEVTYNYYYTRIQEIKKKEMYKSGGSPMLVPWFFYMYSHSYRSFLAGFLCILDLRILWIGLFV